MQQHIRTVDPRSSLALALAGTFGLLSAPAAAVPSFAVQTGQPCTACHVGGYGPQLTPFGREFKIGGYVNRAAACSVSSAAPRARCRVMPIARA